MTVYLVIDGDGRTIDVFATRALAQAYINAQTYYLRILPMTVRAF